MMRKITLVLASLLLLLTAHAQNTATDSTAPCVAYWRKGEVKNLVIKKTSITMDAGKEKKASSSTHEATLTVLDSTEKSYTLEWKYKPNKKSEIPELETFNNLLTQLKVIYSVTETGAYDSLINYEELKKYISEMLDELSKLSDNKKDMSATLTQYLPLLKSKEGIESIFLKDIQTYHAPYGIEYSTKEPQTYETELPNVLGGDPFPAVVTLTLNKVDIPNDLAVIDISQDVDKEKAVKLMKEFFVRLSKAQNKPLPEGEILTSMEIQDHYQYDLVLSDGWIRRMFTKRIIKIRDMDKTETCEITIK